MGAQSNKGKVLTDFLAMVHADITIHKMINTIKMYSNIPPEKKLNNWSLVAYQKRGNTGKWYVMGAYPVSSFDSFTTFRLMSWVGNDHSFKFILTPCKT